MNEFYHAFHIGFNWWYIIIPLDFVACVLFATLLYKLKARRNGRLRIRQNYKQVTQLIVAVPFTALNVWLMVTESGAGLIQIFDNHLAANDSGAWSIIAAAGVMGFVTMVLFTLHYEVAFRLGRAIKYALYSREIKIADLRSKIVPMPDPIIEDLESRNWDE